MKKIVLIVLDGFGVGEMPDSKNFNDEGSNSYLNTLAKTNVDLINLKKLGLNNIDGLALYNEKQPFASYCKLEELTYAKDTTAGHYEMAGLILKQPYKVFKSFPKKLLEKIEKKANIKFMGNEIASGTEIIQRLGDEHLKLKQPIVYTSADSVMQIAADLSIFTLEELYNICKIAREIMIGDNAVGRIIARPFIHDKNGNFIRTADRHDYALSPPKETMLDKLKNNNFDVIGLGKIYDIFNGQGITKSIKTNSNKDGIEKLINLLKEDISINGLIFVNLVDTDMLYGHRNNVEGYAAALKEFDNNIPTIINLLNKDDILLITGDHGCDPTTNSTDHSREYVPLLIYKQASKSKNFGIIKGFNIISKNILNYFEIEKTILKLF